MTREQENSPLDVQQLRLWARKQLTRSGHDINPREANLLLGYGLHWTEVEVLTRGQETLDEHQVQRIQHLILERCSGRPFAYLQQAKEFFGRTFYVDERTLIPRPETEHLIEATLALSPIPQRILDLGTGSGCIAITLALELPEAQVLASDLSIAALAVARRNATALGLGAAQLPDTKPHRRLALAASDLAGSFDLESFDTIVSNPPYVATDAVIASTVRDFEPPSALFAHNGGLAIYQRLVGPKTPLQPGQRLVLELGADQRAAVVEMAASRFEVLSIVEDLAGWQRVLSLKKI